MGYYKFPGMARVAQHSEEYSFGLAIYGWNNKNYEEVNGEGFNM
ncbi:hypothetical protein [Flavonifractor hominis]